MNANLQAKIELNNGVKMPQLGLGVWKSSIDDAAKAVQTALANDYVLIDTAKQYGNESGVGKGIQAAIDAGTTTRQNVFLTTKIYNGDQFGDYDHIRQAFNGQLKALQTNYVDLLLIHWPVDGHYLQTWKALEAILKDGQARAIGVCNFDVERMTKLLDAATVKPAVNQIEFNPSIRQPEIVKFCRAQGIKMEAWSPLGNGRLLQNPVVKSVAENHGKTTAQVEIRWGLQHGMIEIPKTVHEDRMRQNAAVFDFQLTGDEMKQLDSLDQEKHTLWYHNYKWNGNPNGTENHIGKPGHW